MKRFQGFGEDGLAFLRELTAHNEKAFYDANKKRYEACLLEPARAFVGELQEELRRRVSPHVQADPRVGSSIFRIRRDTRFSRNKLPYKTYFDLWLWEGASDKGRDDPGLFLRIEHDKLTIGVGMHHIEREQLQRYREAVADDERGAALAEIVRAIEEQPGFYLGGEGYKRVPRGFDKDHPRARLLKHAGLFAHHEDRPPPAVMFTPDFVDYVASWHEKAAPLHQWLVRQSLSETHERRPRPRG